MLPSIIKDFLIVSRTEFPVGKILKANHFISRLQGLPSEPVPRYNWSPQFAFGMVSITLSKLSRLANSSRLSQLNRL